MSTQGIKIYFGDVDDQLSKDYDASIELLDYLRQRLNLEKLCVARQVHGIDIGVVENQGQSVLIFHKEVDSLITNQIGLGIGIFTADCLPVLLYDSTKKIVAAVHVGWKGAVKGVLEGTLKKLEEQYQVDARDLHIFFGPAIKVCCYEVGSELIESVQNTAHARLSLYEWEGRFFFDIVEFSRQVLLGKGCQLIRMNRTNNLCTHCNLTYFSYRRDGQKSGRQINIIALE